MRNLIAAAVGAAAALLAAPAGAAAAVSCDFSSGVLDVSLGASGDVLAMSTDKGEILLGSPGGTAPVCTGGTPTTSNTNAISVHNSPGMSENAVGIFNANEYAPGLSDEPGDNEIEIFVNLNDGARTALFVGISVSPGRLVFGTNGINTNAADNEDQPDRDIDHNDTAAALTGSGSPGPDLLSAQGGRGTGGPSTREITFFGGEGNDVILPGSATDPVDGGDGEDILSYDGLASGVSVALEGTAAEHLYGTAFGDVLLGDDGPNRILGQEGNDQIDGRGGADDLSAGSGDDALQIRDGQADTADCGPGPEDTVTADLLAVDLLTGCETVIFPPAPAGGGGPALPAAFGARTLVTITLAGRRIRPTGRLAVRISNANGFDVSGTLSGRRKRHPRVAARSFSVPANARRTVALRLPKALRRQLGRKRTVSLRMTAKVRDPAGNTRVVSRTLRPRARARTSKG